MSRIPRINLDYGPIFGDGQDENYVEQYQIDLKGGIPTIYRDVKDNSVQFTKTNLYLVIPFSMLGVLLRLGNLFYLAVALIMLIEPSLSPFQRWSVIFPLLIYMIVHVIKDLLDERQLRKESKYYNENKTRKHANAGTFEDVKWKDIKPGDLVLLKNNETCPADILILDTSLPKNRGTICWLDTVGIDGFTTYTLKKALQTTKINNKKADFNGYRRILNGKIEYEPPSKDVNRFSGYIRLKKDPRAEQISMENLILRGSILKNTEWVYGIVLYTGHDCRMMQNANYTKYKRSYFEKIVERLYLYGILMVMIFSAVATFSLISTGTLSGNKDDPLIRATEDNADGLRFFYNIVLYSPFVPISFYVTFDIILIIQRRVLHSLKPKNSTESHVTVYESKVLPNLGQVDYCFLDKTGTITTGNYKIRGILTGNKHYVIDSETLKERVPDFLQAKDKNINRLASEFKYYGEGLTLKIDDSVLSNNNRNDYRRNSHDESSRVALQAEILKDSKLATLTTMKNGAKPSLFKEKGNSPGSPQNDKDPIEPIDPPMKGSPSNKSSSSDSEVDSKEEHDKFRMPTSSQRTITYGWKPKHPSKKSNQIPYQRERSELIFEDPELKSKDTFSHNELKDPINKEVTFKLKDNSNLNINASHNIAQDSVITDSNKLNIQIPKQPHHHVLAKSDFGPQIEGLDIADRSPKMDGECSPKLEDKILYINEGVDLEKSPDGRSNHGKDDNRSEASFMDSGTIQKRKVQPGAAGDLRLQKFLNQSAIRRRNSVDIGMSIIGKKEESGDIKRKSNLIDMNNPISDSMSFEHDYYERNFNDIDFLTDYYNREENFLEEFMEILALCHSAKTTSHGLGSENTFETVSPDEYALIKFGAFFEKEFLACNKQDNPDEYTYKDKGEKKKVEIMGVNDWSYDRKRFSIVYKKENTEKAVISCKGPVLSMKNTLLLDELEIENFERAVNQWQENGWKVIVFAKRELEAAEATEYAKKYQNFKMSLYDQDGDLEDLAKGIEKELRLVGVIALQDHLKEESMETIQMLQDADIKVWMLTGDNRENALNAANLTGIIDQNFEVHHIKLDNNNDEKEGYKQDARGVIRTILNRIKKSYLGETATGLSKDQMHKKINKSLTAKNAAEQRYHFAITIDGPSLDKILRDPFLKANFEFICAMSYSLVGYMLSPKQKEKMVRMVNENFPNDPITMAIGDGLNDSLMLETADVGIELKSKPGLLASNCGDFKLTEFGALKDLLLVRGRNISMNIDSIIHFTFFKSYSFGLMLFAYNFYTKSTGAPLFDSMFVFMYTFIFTFIPLIMFGVYNKTEPSAILKAFPALYIDGKMKKQNAWKTFLAKSIFESLVHSAIIFFFTMYVCRYGVGPDGEDSSTGMVSLIMFYAMVFLSNAKLFFHYREKTWSSVLGFIISFICLIIYIVVNDYGQFVDNRYMIETSYIFRRPATLLCLIFVSLTPTSLSYLIKHEFIEKNYASTYDLYATKRSVMGEIGSINNEDILVRNSGKFELGNTVRSIYKNQPDLMDSLVYDMLSPADRNATNIGINKLTLKFLDKKLERRYIMTSIHQAFKNIRYIYFGLLFYFAAYVIGEAVRDYKPAYILSRIGVFVLFLCVGGLLFTQYFRHRFYPITLVIMVTSLIAKLIYDWVQSEDTSYSAALVPVLVSTLLNVSAFRGAVLNIVHYVIWIIRIIILYTSQNSLNGLDGTSIQTIYVIASYILLELGITVLMAVLGYRMETEKRVDFSANTQIAQQVNVSQGILSILLPKFIIDKIDPLVGDDRHLAEDQGEVALLFCDIMDFDKVVEKEGAKVAKILDDIFRAFDQCSASHGIQKIETVGKTYMGCGGLKDCEATIPKAQAAMHPIRRILNLALDMDDFVHRTTYGNGTAMKIRIGIHYGKVIAGVIGYHKPQFSLIGDTVNTTSRVCTTNNNGQIRISDDAYQKLVHAGGAGRLDIHFIKVSEEMKGKGQVIVHIVAKTSTQVALRQKVNVLKKVANKAAMNSETPKANGVKAPETFEEAAAGTPRVGNPLMPVKSPSKGTIAESNPPKLRDIKKKKTAKITLKAEEAKENLFVSMKKLLNTQQHIEPKKEGEERQDKSELRLANDSKNASKDLIRLPSDNNVLKEPSALNGSKQGKSDKQKNGDRDRSATYIRSRQEIEGLDEEEDEKVQNKNDEDLNVIHPSRKLLSLKGNPKKKVGPFLEYVYLKTKRFHRVTLVIFFVIYIIQTALMITTSNYFTAPTVIIVLRFVFLAMLALYYFFVQCMKRRTYMKGLSSLALILGIIATVTQGCLSSSVAYARIQVVELLYIYLLITYSTHIDFVWNLGMSLVTVLTFFIGYGASGNLTLDNVYFVILFVNCNLPQVHNYIKNTIKFYNSYQIREKRKIEQGNLVGQLLPPHALEKLTNDTGKSELGDIFNDVTILYADIKGFTDYSASVEPKRVVKMLSSLFTKFDKACMEQGLYKVYTIGDCYVVLSFIDANNRDPGYEAIRVVKMALEMISIIREVRKEIDYDGLDMRIGIHTGTVIGGVVGTEVVRYDIWGKDVIIANNMESHGEKGNINVSETTKTLLESSVPGLYRFEFRENVVLDKISAQINSYLLYENATSTNSD